MNLFALKSLSALANLLLVSLVVRLFPVELTAGYLLMIGYVQFGTLGLGFGIDTSMERYALKVLNGISKLRLLILVIVAALFRTAAFFGVITLANLVSPGFIEVQDSIYLLAFFTFLLTTQTSLLNGILLYVSSAAANLARAAFRFGIFLVPLGALTLEMLLRIEAAAAGVALIYSIAIFAHAKIEASASPIQFKAVGRFMSWNYLTRFLLNLLSLNMVKILILRSNHPHAVLIAYAIQLTEAVERFLPSVVLAGRYRPELSKAYDERLFGELVSRFRQLANWSILSSIVAAVAHLVALPLAFIILQNEAPDPFWPIFITCSIWLVVSNWKFSLNIVSNVIEENHIQFFVSLALVTIFYSIYFSFDFAAPFAVLALMLACLGLYPLVWFGLARSKVKRLYSTA